jgi:heme/copper-type cytochrome/quinol oxidase subunit 2
LILKKSKAYSVKDYKNKDINLLPPEFSKVSRTRLLSLIAVACSVIAIVAFGYYEYSIYNQTKDYENDTLVKKMIIQANNQKVENQMIILSLGERIQRKEILLDYIFSTNRSVIQILDRFENSLNTEVYLSSLTADSTDSFSILATADSHEDVSQLINELKLLKKPDGNKYFEDVFVSGLTLKEDYLGDKHQVFELHCKFEGGVEDETK